METLNIICTMELMDTVDYAEKLRKGQKIGIKRESGIYVITKTKRDEFTLTKEEELISTGNAIRVAGDIEWKNESFARLLEQEKKNAKRRAEILAKDPEAYTRINVINA